MPWRPKTIPERMPIADETPAAIEAAAAEYLESELAWNREFDEAQSFPCDESRAAERASWHALHAAGDRLHAALNGLRMFRFRLADGSMLCEITLSNDRGGRRRKFVFDDAPEPMRKGA